MRDLASNLKVLPALSPAVQAATVNGAAIDLLGYGSAAFVLTTGAIDGSGDFGAKLQASDDAGEILQSR